jgi:hypothetical protein
LALKDLARFRILERSIELFWNDLHICWVVTPDKEHAQIKKSIHDNRYRVIPEGLIIPETEALFSVKGWYRQQLVKLAIAPRVTTPFYVTLDADVICTRAFSSDDFIKEGRAISGRYRGPTHAEWYAWAERVLKLKRSGWVHCVTPSVLSREAVLRLAEYLTTLSSSRSQGSEAGESGSSPRLYPGWRGYLLANVPWTEYTLYFTYLEATGLYEDFHFASDRHIYADCVWQRDQFAAWQPEKIFHTGEHCFTLVQSYSKLRPSIVWKKVKPFLGRPDKKNIKFGREWLWIARPFWRR